MHLFGHFLQHYNFSCYLKAICSMCRSIFLICIVEFLHFSFYVFLWMSLSRLWTNSPSQIQRHITLWRTRGKKPHSLPMSWWASCWGASQQLWRALGRWARCVWVPCWIQPPHAWLTCPWDWLWHPPSWLAFHSLSQSWALPLSWKRWALSDGCISIWASFPRAPIQAPFDCERWGHGFHHVWFRSCVWFDLC